MLLPKVVKISRSQVIQASAEQLFSYFNNPRNLQEWNPFSDGDSSVAVDFSGPAEGVGAKWSWRGKKAGVGSATITESEPNKRVVVRLEFVKPFKATNYGEYSLKPKGSATEVTWIINESAFMPRLINIFVSLDKLVGSQFEKGLLKLQLIAETKRH